MSIRIAVALAFLSAAAIAKPPDTVFFKTQDSDEWVRHNLKVQQKYSRVLVVTTAPSAPKTVSVAPLDFGPPDQQTAPAAELPVAAVYATLQEAADEARGGELVAVMPGTYAGFWIGDKPEAHDGAYIHFKAMGKPGQVVLNQAAKRQENDWLILLEAAHHVIVQGFSLDGSKADPERAGVMLDGNFGVSGKLTHHAAIMGVFSHDNGSWGLHSTDSHTVLIQDSLFARSKREHSAYVSDGSDNYVIRRNVFYGSSSSGLQCNLDPNASLAELAKNPAMADVGPRPRMPRVGGRRSSSRPSTSSSTTSTSTSTSSSTSSSSSISAREWAMKLLAAANEKFGQNNYPDGKGLNFIIENNVICGNGNWGGGAMNLAGLQDSLVQNNLIYDNPNHGIAQWDNGNFFDRALVSPGPKTPNDIKGPDDLPTWGCHGNTIRNNTVLLDSPYRAALQCINGSWGCRVRNNILINNQPSSIEISNTGIYRLDSGYNVINGLLFCGDMPNSIMAGITGKPTPMDDSLKSLAVKLDADNHTTAGITLEEFAGEVVRYGKQPWVLIEGDWWRLNPDRPDFRPRRESKLLVGTGEASSMAPMDLTGRKRDRSDMGALQAE